MSENKVTKKDIADLWDSMPPHVREKILVEMISYAPERAIAEIGNPSDEVQIAFLTNTYAGAVNNQLDFMKQYVGGESHISDAARAFAINQCGAAIRFVSEKYQSPELQLAAVKQSPEAIQHIKNPSDDLVVQHMLVHADSAHTPQAIEARAPALLNAHTAGLGDVYTMARGMGYEGDELRDRMQAHIERQVQVSLPEGQASTITMDEFKPIDLGVVDTGATIEKLAGKTAESLEADWAVIAVVVGGVFERVR